MTNVVIGGGSGMGTAIARRLAPEGRLLLADRDVEAAEALAEELGGHVEAVGCDVSDEAQIDALFAKVDDLGSLVHTAGLSGTMASGRQILAVNLLGVARVVRAAESKLREGTVGVFIASQSGYSVPEVPELFDLLADPLAEAFLDELARWYDIDQPAHSYQMSKRGVHRVVRQSAAAWGAKGARIMSVSPGINDTPMNRSDEAAHPIMAEIIKNAPIGRRGTPEEIANVVEFILSPAAALLTGSDVLADGGMVSVLPVAWEGKLHPPS